MKDEPTAEEIPDGTWPVFAKDHPDLVPPWGVCAGAEIPAEARRDQPVLVHGENRELSLLLDQSTEPPLLEMRPGPTPIGHDLGDDSGRCAGPGCGRAIRRVAWWGRIGHVVILFGHRAKCLGADL